MRFQPVLAALGVLIIHLLLGCASMTEMAPEASSSGASQATAPPAPPASEYFEAEAAESDNDGALKKSRAQFHSVGAKSADLDRAPNEGASGGSNDPASKGEPGSQEAKRSLLIYSASLSLGVFEVREKTKAVIEIAKKAGGYLVSEQDQMVQIRVPAKEFEATLAACAALGDELGRTVNVRDVTLEYTDIESQLKNLRVMKSRMEELLLKAQNVEEALKIETELQRLTTELEKLLGRLAVLSELIHYSTITVQFQARPVDQVNQEFTLPFPWLRELGLPGLLSL